MYLVVNHKFAGRRTKTESTRKEENRIDRIEKPEVKKERSYSQ